MKTSCKRVGILVACILGGAFLSGIILSVMVGYNYESSSVLGGIAVGAGGSVYALTLIAFRPPCYPFMIAICLGWWISFIASLVVAMVGVKTGRLVVGLLGAILAAVIWLLLIPFVYYCFGR